MIYFTSYDDIPRIAPTLKVEGPAPRCWDPPPLNRNVTVHSEANAGWLVRPLPGKHLMRDTDSVDSFMLHSPQSNTGMLSGDTGLQI